MKTIIISGGSDGLGKALAKHLTDAGNKVIVLAPNEEKVTTAAKEIGCAFRVCDVSKWAQVETAVKSIISEYGDIDVLINNAGVTYASKIEEAVPEEIQHIFDVNVVGVLFLTKAVVPSMKKKSSGCIININSQGGIYTKAERALYNGSKWAVTGITKVLQAELAPSNIKVTGLYPGAMEQRMKINDKRGPQNNSFAYQEMADAVDFILSRGPNTAIPELGIKNINN